MYRIGKEYYGRSGEKRNRTSSSTVDVILDENEIWHMQVTWLQPLPSTEETPRRRLKWCLRENARSMYEAFTKYNISIHEAIDIIGIYYYAAEVGDFETRYHR